MSDGLDRLHRQFHDVQHQYLAISRRNRDPRKRRSRTRKPSYSVAAGTDARFYRLDRSQVVPAPSRFSGLIWRAHRTLRQQEFHQLVGELDDQMFFVDSCWLIAVPVEFVRIRWRRPKLGRQTAS